uniref:Uncharacterized protein n=1 Tax=Arundo donax TaxID=35708 RepID=A0A0A9GHV3_ARUDO
MILKCVQLDLEPTAQKQQIPSML